MAKYRRYRKYSRRSGTRWAPNIVKISNRNQASPGEFFNAEVLAENPINTNTGVAQTFTVKNCEIAFTIEPDGPSAISELESITVYIMYVPQGMNLTSSYYVDHPEYIMAYKYLGSPGGRIPIVIQQGATSTAETQQFQPIKMKTRLSRKLQTGDRIVLFVQGSNQSESNSYYYNIDGVVRWWSKAN